MSADLPAGCPMMNVVMGSASRDASRRLDPDVPEPVIDGVAFRGPDALPVVPEPSG